MKHGSLFSGIGGFDLAAEWMGWENVFHCEWNDFGKKILKFYWPNAISYDDITKTDFTIHRGQIDILTGGFPCQPYSMAGKRKGKDDERHLWPEMLRAIKEIQPRWIVGENVHGLVNWSRGLVFHEVQADLEAVGYEVFPYVLPAAAVNAPHRRDRVWFVAYAKNNGCNEQWEGIDGSDCQYEVNASEGGGYAQCNFEQMGESNVFNTKCFGRFEVGDDNGKFKKSQQKKCREKQFSRTNSTQSGWRSFPSVPPICDGNDGISDRLDSITFPKWRQESIKGGGNAVVSQLVYMIFKTIKEYEKNK